MSVSTISGAFVQGAEQHRRHQPPPLTTTAQLLGMSADDLRTALQSGTTLADLAASKGVSKDDLVKSIAADLKAARPQGASDLSDAQLTQLATGIADGKRPGRIGGHHHRGGAAKPVGSDPDGDGDTDSASGAADTDATASSDTTSALSQLAAALGVDPANLLARIQSTDGLGSLLSFGSASGYTSGGTPAAQAAAAIASGGLAVDTRA